MFFPECARFAGERPDLKDTIAKIDELLSSAVHSSVFRPDDIASNIGEKESRVSGVLDGLAKAGLLQAEKYLECPDCPNLISADDYEKAEEEEEPFECTQCQRDLSGLTLTETIRYRLKPDGQPQNIKEDEKPTIDIARIIKELRTDKGVNPTPLPSEIRIQFKDPEYRLVAIETKINGNWQWIESEDKTYKLVEDLQFQPLQTGKRKTLSTYLIELAAHGELKIPKGKKHSKEQDKLATAKKRLNEKLMPLFGLEQEPVICENGVYKPRLELLPYKAPDEC
ncbi:MAG: hypothetical protein QME51_02495 [Planctomycetota bacterium]|nr:hypothetical protein [Planctomycetota bacterium]MDI6787224.1 hypothetical protein [Planctomycetota bacterium]